MGVFPVQDAAAIENPWKIITVIIKQSMEIPATSTFNGRLFTQANTDAETFENTCPAGSFRIGYTWESNSVMLSSTLRQCLRIKSAVSQNWYSIAFYCDFGPYRQTLHSLHTHIWQDYLRGVRHFQRQYIFFTLVVVWPPFFGTLNVKNKWKSYLTPSNPFEMDDLRGGSVWEYWA